MSITSFSSVSAKITASGQFNRTISGNPTDVIGQLAISYTTTYTYGTSGADTINQAVTFIFTATANTTTQMDLSGALTNMVGESTATFTKIKWIFFENLSAAQDSTYGTAMTGTLAIKPGSSSPITTSPLGASATNSYTMELGDKWLVEKHNSGGITVASGSADNFAVVNSDPSIDGKVRVTILGNS